MFDMHDKLDSRVFKKNSLLSIVSYLYIVNNTCKNILLIIWLALKHKFTFFTLKTLLNFKK